MNYLKVLTHPRFQELSEKAKNVLRQRAFSQLSSHPRFKLLSPEAQERVRNYIWGRTEEEIRAGKPPPKPTLWRKIWKTLISPFVKTREERIAHAQNVYAIAKDISAKYDVDLDQAIRLVREKFDDIVEKEYGLLTPRRATEKIYTLTLPAFMAPTGLSIPSILRFTTLAGALRLGYSGIDMLIIDTAHGHSDRMIENFQHIAQIKGDYPNIIFVGGNVTTLKGAYELYKAGADGIKWGIGPGFSCMTRRQTGFGGPMISTLYFGNVIAKHFNKKDQGYRFLIADGGASFPGIAVKYFAAGAQLIMMGSIPALTCDSAGFDRRYNPNTSLVDVYGSASDRVKSQVNRPLWDIPEGMERQEPSHGSTLLYFAQYGAGIRSGASYAGVDDIGTTNLQRLARHSRWAMISPNFKKTGGY